MIGLYIRNGRFFRDGVEERPEIGNAEQIKCLRHYERFMETMKDGEVIELEPDEDYPGKMTYYFRCVCGNYLNKSEEIDDQTDVINLFDGKYLFCHVCSQRYKITKRINTYFRELIIKTD